MNKKKVVKQNSPIDDLIEDIKKKRVLKPRDILRLHSKLITSFIQGDVKTEYCRTLSFLCSTQINLYKSVELEKRIKKLEEKYL